MSASTKNLYERSLALSEQERIALAAQILESLEPMDAKAEPAWIAGIEKRLSELDSGAAEPVSWETIRAKLNARLSTVDDS